MPFTRNPTKHANYFYNTKCPEGQAPGNSAPRQGIWGKRNNWLYSCTHTHIYFINFFFLCAPMWSVLFFGFSKSCCSPVGRSGCPDCLGRNRLINTWQEHPSHVAPPYTNSLTVSQGHKWEETVPRGLLTDLTGHLPCEERARTDSDSLFSTAAKPGLGLEMREEKQGCTQTWNIMDLTGRNHAETSKMDLSQPLQLDI